MQVQLTQLHNQSIDYDTIKKQAIAVEPIIGSYPLSAIQLGMKGIMKINGKTVRVNESARNRFLNNVLNVKPEFAARFRENTNEKVEKEMLAALQNGMARMGNTEVQIIANPTTQSITNFSTGKSNFTTHTLMFDMFERTMNRYPNLELKDCYMGNQGEITLNTRSTKEVNLSYEEDFQGGISFTNSADNGSGVTHNALRLICTNGLTGFSKLNLGLAFDKQSLDMFFGKLDKYNMLNWITEDLVDGVQRKKGLLASVNELIAAKEVILKNSQLRKEDIDAFIPMSGVSQYLAKKGIDMQELTPAQRKNCPTNLNLWDLINQLTYFGSHDLGFKADFKSIQSAAGTMFLKKEDAQNMVYFAA